MQNMHPLSESCQGLANGISNTNGARSGNGGTLPPQVSGVHAALADARRALSDLHADACELLKPRRRRAYRVTRAGLAVAVCAVLTSVRAAELAAENCTGIQ